MKFKKFQELHHRIVQKQVKVKDIGFDKEIHKERYIFPEERIRHKIIDDLKLVWYNNKISKNNKSVG